MGRPYNPNITDARAYLYLEAPEISGAYNHIPPFYGFCKTDLGGALCVALMRCADGAIAPTLSNRALRGVDASLKNAVAEYIAFMKKMFAEIRRCPEIPALDPNCFVPDNLMAVRLPRGRERIYAREYKHGVIGYRNLSFFKKKKDGRHIKYLETWLAKHSK